MGRLEEGCQGYAFVVSCALLRAAPLGPGLIVSPGLLSGLVEAMIQYVLGVRRGLAVW